MILDKYLQFLSEEEITLKNKLKDNIGSILSDMGIIIGPIKQCKILMKKQKYIYLYHGTRPKYVESIKKEGLTLKNFNRRAKDEGDWYSFGKPKLYFGNVYTGKQAGFGAYPFQNKPVKYLLAKLDTEYLKISIGGFQYFKDVPPKDLIWDDEPRFHKIGKESPCLTQYGKGRQN